MVDTVFDSEDQCVEVYLMNTFYEAERHHEQNVLQSEISEAEFFNNISHKSSLYPEINCNSVIKVLIDVLSTFQEIESASCCKCSCFDKKEIDETSLQESLKWKLSELALNTIAQCSTVNKKVHIVNRTLHLASSVCRVNKIVSSWFQKSQHLMEKEFASYDSSEIALFHMPEYIGNITQIFSYTSLRCLLLFFDIIKQMLTRAHLFVNYVTDIFVEKSAYFFNEASKEESTHREAMPQKKLEDCEILLELFRVLERANEVLQEINEVILILMRLLCQIRLERVLDTIFDMLETEVLSQSHSHGNYEYKHRAQEFLNEEMNYIICGIGRKLVNELFIRSTTLQSLQNPHLYQLYTTTFLHCVWPYMSVLLEAKCFFPQKMHMMEIEKFFPKVLTNFTKLRNKDLSFNAINSNDIKLFNEILMKFVGENNWFDQKLEHSSLSASCNSNVSIFHCMEKSVLEFFKVLTQQRVITNNIANQKLLSFHSKCSSTLHAIHSDNIDEIIKIANIPLLLSSQHALHFECHNKLQNSTQKSSETNVFRSEELNYNNVHNYFLPSVAGRLNDFLWIHNVANTNTKAELSITCHSFETSEFMNGLCCTQGSPDNLIYNSLAEELQILYIDGTLSFERWVDKVLLAPMKLASEYIEQIHYHKLLSILPSTPFSILSNYELLRANNESTKKEELNKQENNQNVKRWEEKTLFNFRSSLKENTHRESDEYLSMINTVRYLPLRDVLEFIIDVALFIDRRRSLQAFITSLVQQPFWALQYKSMHNYNGANTCCIFLSQMFSKCMQTHYLGGFVHLIVNPNTLRHRREQIQLEEERINKLIAANVPCTKRSKVSSKYNHTKLSDKMLIFASLELYFTFPNEICKLLGVRHLNSAPQHNVTNCVSESESVFERAENKMEHDINDSSYNYNEIRNYEYCKWSELFRSQCILHYTYELVNQRRFSLARAERDRAVQKAVLGSNKVITRSLRELYSTQLKLIQTMEFTINSLIRFTETEIANVVHNHFNTISKNIETYCSGEILRKEILTTLGLLTHTQMLVISNNNDDKNSTDEDVKLVHNKKEQNILLIQNILNKFICECACENAKMYQESVSRITSSTSLLNWSTPSPSSSSSSSLTRKVRANLSVPEINDQLKVLQKLLNEIHRCNRLFISSIVTLDESDDRKKNLLPLVHLMTFNNFYMDE